MNSYKRGFRQQFFKSNFQSKVAALFFPLIVFFHTVSVSAQQCVSTPVEVGYRTISYDNSGLTGYPTETKPESKLWWNDGFWWGILWDPVLRVHRIHKFDVANQCWISVGPNLDERTQTSADVLWYESNQKLYISSRAKEGVSVPSPETRFSRFSYNSSTDTYSLDSGFPVQIQGDKVEALVIARDSQGKMWATWEINQKIMVSSTNGSDTSWGTPFILPVQGNNVSAGDISSIIAFGGNKIGVMWSNQLDKKMYFAIHIDGNGDTTWQPREDALGDPNLGNLADNHINLALSLSDGGNTVVAATKTSLSADNAPLIFLLKRTGAGVWSSHVYGFGKELHTRPIVLVNSDNDSVYVIAKAKTTPIKIFIKRTHLSNPSFQPGVGEVFISSSTDDDMNDPTSTKQNVNAQTGLLVLVSDKASKNYLHNFLSLTGNVPVINSFSPASGGTGSQITIAGINFTGATSVKFNGMSATFFVDSGVQIRANVPVGAATGKISVTTSQGTGTSIDDFTVIFSPQITSFTPTDGPIPTEVTVTGNNFVQVSSVKFNGVSASSFTVDSITQLRATVPNGATTGPISVTNPAGTGTSGANFIVRFFPTIISFSPASGPVAAAVTISGDNFNGTTAVTFNGIAASTFVVDSNTQIRANVPGGATTGKISVTNADGATQSASDFTVIPPPTVSGFNPPSGPIGTPVTVTGTSFTTATTVQFNGISASFTIDSNTQIRATAPNGATTGSISVTNVAGSAASAANFMVTFIPSISSFSPASGVVGSNVTITGNNLTGTTSVAFNGVSASFLVDSNTQIQATVPAGATTGKISVTNSDGTGQSTNDFVVILPPTISSFNPSSGYPTIEVTISGTNFSSATNVSFNGVSATFSIDSSTQIRGAVPAGATSGKISVTNSAGTVLSVNDFTVTTAPSILTFNPADDTFINSGSPNAPYGSELDLRVRKSGATIYAFLKFNITGLGSSIQSAKLRLKVIDASSDGGGVYSVSNNYGINANPWTEGGLTWNNAPVVSGSPLSSLGAVALNQVVEFDVTAAIAGNGIFSFAITNNTSDVLKYDPKEGTTKPELVINMTNSPVPSIDSFTPTSGPVATNVTITGINFSGATAVAFNGIAASFTIDSSTQIRASVPAGATSGKITVTNSIGSGQSANDFVVIHPPTVTSFNPISGPIGASVTVTGTNFTNISDVKFNGASAASFAVDSATQLRATVPSGATTGPINVTNVAGTGSSATNFDITFVPSISAFDPASGPVGTPVTITGNNFTGATSVQFNGIAAAFTVDSNSQIRTSFPVGSTTGKISVTNADGTGQSAADFIVIQPPTVSSSNPTTGPIGTSVTVTGTNFTNISDVKFNGVSAVGFTVDTATQLRATVPSGATTGPISVTNVAGTGSSATNFAITFVPSISAFDPASGAVGTPVTITGNNFTGATNVQFNGIAATFTVDSNTQVRANVPSGATTGKISITNLDGTGQSTNDFTVIQPPIISSFTPISGPPSTEVTVAGTNFSTATSVLFHGTPATSFVADSGTQLRATVPSGATTGPISITNPAGTILSATNFTVTTGPSILTLNPTDDTFINSGSPNAKYGSDLDLRVRKSGASIFAFLKFNVSGIGGSIQSAKLRLKVIDASTDGGAIYSVSNDYGNSASPWTESGLNWINAPAIIGSPLSAQGAVSLNQIVEFDVTAAITGNGVYSFAIKNNVTDVLKYDPKEGGTKPELVINLVNSSLPIIDSFSPASGPVATAVTIAGINFSNATAVAFNGTSASFVIDSNTQIRATVPAGVTSGPITVTNTFGTGQSAGNFAVIFPPTVSSFNPIIGPIGTPVTMMGTSFTTATDVKFNGVSASFAVDSATQLRANVPNGATTGPISITNVAGTGSSASNFAVTFIPSISSVDPSSGPVGTPVTITGNNFTGTIVVTFNGLASTFTVDSNTQIRATVPNSATTGKISVTNAHGTAQSLSDFIVIQSPTVSSFNPTSGPPTSAVTVTGTNFIAVTNVLFNGAPAASFTIDSGTQLRATVPIGATTGPISVTNPAGTGMSANDFVITAPPSILTFNPTNDTFINSGSPNANYGSDLELRVRKSGANIYSFLKFNVTGVIGTIQNAKIRLKVIDASADGGGIYSVSNDYGTSASSWTESGLTWNNAPAILGSPLSSLGAVSLNQIVEYQVTPAITGNGTYSFAIKNNLTDILKYDPKEGGTAPELLINVLTSPLPVISSFLPSSGSVTTAVTLHGVNFSSASTVAFNGVPASFVIDSNSQIRTVVPVSAISGKISVTNADGTAESDVNFTVIHPPTLTSFNPTTGLVGTPVTVTGTNFSSVSSVTFNGVSASFTIDSATQLRTNVPAGATSGLVSVINLAGVANSASNFVVTFVPSISSFTPTSGPVGTPVTITGNNLTGITDVKFNGVSATSFIMDSITQVRANVPTGASSGKITVTNPYGTAQSANDFTFIPPPTITSFNPTIGPVGTLITVTGTNFISVSSVTLNGVAAIFTLDSPTQLRASVPPGATTGAVSITTVAGVAASASNFVVTFIPSITSFTPTSGIIGSAVTITGNNFNGATALTFNGVSAPGFVIDSNTQIRANVPAGATTGKISITNASGTGQSAIDFVVILLPTITSFNPTIGPVGMPVTVTGTNFINLNSITFNGVSASFTVDSVTQLRTTVPAGATTGLVRATNAAGTANSPSNFVVTYIPSVTSFTPANGPAGTPVTIAGNNFTGTTSVAFNGVAAANVTIDSNTQIRANVPSGATTGKISVTNADGTGQSAADFVVFLLPTISSFDPTIGPVGTLVTLTGTNFSDVTSVTFNGVTGIFTLDSATQLRVSVPPGAATGPIAATSPAGTAVSATNFVVTFTPSISSFTPTTGPVGTPVVITGNNFNGTTDVKFNGVSAIFTTNSNTQVSTSVPSGATTGQIIMTNAAGSGHSIDDFVVIHPPAISSFNPVNGMAGAPITITGTNFNTVSSLTFNGTSASFTIDSATQLRTTVPASATTGPITVANPAGTGASANDFTVPVSAIFIPTDDARVWFANPTTNYGSTTDLRVRFNTSPQTAYLKFNVTGLGGAVVSAKIKVRVTDSSIDGGSIHSVSNNYAGTTTPWTESGLQWVNAPAISGSPLSSLGPVINGQTVEFNVTAAIAGDGIYSFGIKSSSDDAAIYNSSESANPPQLLIDIATSPVPVISSFTPASGGVGTAVTLSGINFDGSTNVTFAGIAASFVVDSNSQIRTTVPAGVLTGRIIVINAEGAGQSATDFVVVAPPAVSSFNPTSGNVATEVTIAGVNFSAATAVAFNGLSAAVFTVDSNSQIRANVPSGASTGPISVTNVAGTGTSSANFTVTALPIITSFSPTSGGFGAEVTINGSNFTGTTAVKFNGLSAAGFNTVSNTQIRATVPSGATTGKISVTNAGTGQSAIDFVVVQPPVITSFNPTSGNVGTEVTMSGANFNSTSSVKFNGTSTPIFTVDSDSQLRANAPNGATTGPISVTNAGGTTTTANNFTMSPAPTIASFNPTNEAAGTEVTITGNNFTGAAEVKFNGVSAVSFQGDSNTRIRAIFPDGATPGKISVSNYDGVGQSVSSFAVATSPSTVTFTANDDARVWSALPTTNYGSANDLRVRGNSSFQYAFLKFNVAGLSGAVASAKIRLLVTEGSNDGGAVYSVSNNYNGTATAWVESGLVWDNAPVISGSSLSSLGAISNNSIVEFDVTAAISGDGSYSFAIKNNSNDTATYSSKEGTVTPALVINLAIAASLTGESIGGSNDSRLNDKDSELIFTEEAVLPEKISLSPNYPNPFNLETTFEYGLPKESRVRLVIYNVKGQEVRSLVDGLQPAGFKKMIWNGRNNFGIEIGSGVFFLRLEVNGETFTRKITLQK